MLVDVICLKFGLKVTLSGEPFLRRGRFLIDEVFKICLGVPYRFSTFFMTFLLICIFASACL